MKTKHLLLILTVYGLFSGCVPARNQSFNNENQSLKNSFEAWGQMCDEQKANGSFKTAKAYATCQNNALQIILIPNLKNNPSMLAEIYRIMDKNLEVAKQVDKGTITDKQAEYKMSAEVNTMKARQKPPANTNSDLLSDMAKGLSRGMESVQKSIPTIAPQVDTRCRVIGSEIICHSN